MGSFSKSNFECKACGTRFKTEGELMEHGKMHIKAKATEDHSSHEHFSCSAYGMMFHSDAELRQHGQRPHGVIISDVTSS